MKITLIQISPEWENPEKTIGIIESMNLKDLDSDLIVFPEMTLTGFTMNSDKFGEEIDGISTSFFIELSSKLNTDIIAGILERSEDKIFNTAVHFNKGLITARYRKIHLFSYAKEDKYYDESDELVITRIGNKLFGLTVCYDLRFPELYRMYAKRGIDALVNIANWPVARIAHWNHLLKARAIENLCFSIGCNRVGEDPFLQYSGQSAVYSPMGNEQLLAENKEGLFTVDLDFDMVGESRKKFNFLDDIKLVN